MDTIDKIFSGILGKVSVDERKSLSQHIQNFPYIIDVEILTSEPFSNVMNYWFNQKKFNHTEFFIYRVDMELARIGFNNKSNFERFFSIFSAAEAMNFWDLSLTKTIKSKFAFKVLSMKSPDPDLEFVTLVLKHQYDTFSN